jgi:phosphomannomutase
MGQRPQLQSHHWEGVYAAEFTLDGVRRRAATLASLLAGHGWSCIVAHDTRFMASQYALDLFRTLDAAGVRCWYATQSAPLPAIERALEARRADCAAIITAGNRPYWYGGLHVITPPLEQALFSEPLAAPDVVRPFPPSGEPTEASQIDLRALYLDTLRSAADIELIRRSSLTVILDAMGGTAGGYVSTLLGERSQTRVIEINREPDVLFGRQSPHPGEAHLARIRKLMRESDSQLGVALSADGRALMAVDNLGDLLAPGEVALIIGQHLSRQHRQRGVLVIPPTASDLLGSANRWEETYGLKIEASETPQVRIHEMLEHERTNLVVGMTNQGELTLGRNAGIADGLVAVMVLIEAVARSGLKLRPLLHSLRGR